MNSVLILLILALGLALGGSSQDGFWGAGVIQVASAALLCWLIWTRAQLTGGAWALIGLGAVFFATAVIQLVPLPAELWSLLPGRAAVAAGFDQLGLTRPALPISLTPSTTFLALGGFLPPLAAFVLAASTPTKSVTIRLAWAILIAAALSMAFGLAQLVAGAQAPLYPYTPSNRGAAIGFFANANHQAAFLLIALPFAAVLGANQRVRTLIHYEGIGKIGLLWAFIVLLILGIVLSGSWAIYALLGPLLLAAAVIYSTNLLRANRLAVLAAVLLAGGAAIWVGVYSPMAANLGLRELSSGASTVDRLVVFANTAKAIWAYLPFGSGLGSFRDVYPLFQDQDKIGPYFIPFAHNDLLQLVLEMGVVGIVLIVGAVAWLVRLTLQVWREPRPDVDTRLRRAASLALWVLMLHSIVDYPTRAPAIAILAGLMAGILVSRSTVPDPEDDAAKPARRNAQVEV
jgi:O-antigen ligase